MISGSDNRFCGGTVANCWRRGRMSLRYWLRSFMITLRKSLASEQNGLAKGQPEKTKLIEEKSSEQYFIKNNYAQ